MCSVPGLPRTRCVWFLKLNPITFPQFNTLQILNFPQRLIQNVSTDKNIINKKKRKIHVCVVKFIYVYGQLHVYVVKFMFMWSNSYMYMVKYMFMWSNSCLCGQIHVYVVKFMLMWSNCDKKFQLSGTTGTRFELYMPVLQLLL